ncbi:MAG: glycerol-3-phosphate dehydrogenase subunit GlpB [Propionibacteriaceae bacterium]|jgi:glycerol-3-phosphate dehydrogenase subunit B|nr:glycerol-3-phosphate dehydrogenase subunit GlpB [Propionibacteriaceae bacterium]
MTDTIVIGAGLSGLVSAIRLAQAGQDVTLLAQGLGGLQLSQGTVDVLGYASERVSRPFKTLAALIKTDPHHPYAAIGADNVKSGLTWLSQGLPGLLVGDPELNRCFPTAVGALRPTCLYQPSMAGGAALAGAEWAIVGPRQLKDFYPELCAANLSRSVLPDGGQIEARPYRIDLPARPGEADCSALTYARRLDQEDFRAQFAQAVAQTVGDAAAIGLPAMLGLNAGDGLEAWRDLERRLGRPVFEIALAPPSVPGLRLNQALTALAKASGVRMILGSQVIGLISQGWQVQGVILRQAGRDQRYDGSHFVYAPGGFESGALHLDSYGQLRETAFGLPLRGGEADDLITGDYWQDQALFKVGVGVDAAMRVIDEVGQPVYQNLHAAGGILAGASRWSEKSGEGIALGSAIAATDAILKGQ